METLLTEALGLLQRGFCGTHSAENKFGREVPLTWSTAVAWSVSGAICRASWNQRVMVFDSRQMAAFKAIEDIAGLPLGRWESQPAVTQEVAVETVRQAISNLQAQEVPHVDDSSDSSSS